MIETGPEVKEPTLSPEKTDRLKGDRQLTENVISLVEKGTTDFYSLRRMWEKEEQGVWECISSIRPEGKEDQIPDKELKTPLIVEITTYDELHKTGLLGKERVRIDFPNRQKREKAGHPWVWSIDEDGNPDSTADHQKRVALANELLSKGVPIKDITKPEQAKKLEIAPIFEEIPTGLAEKQEAKLLEEPIETLAKLAKERPVLVGLVVENRRQYLQGQGIKIDEILDDPTMKVLKDEKVWENKSIARQISAALVDALKEAGLEKEALDTHPITKFLMGHLGFDCYVLFAQEGLFERLSEPVKGKILVEAGEKIGAKQEALKIGERWLTGVAIGAPAVIASGIFAAVGLSGAGIISLEASADLAIAAGAIGDALLVSGLPVLFSQKRIAKQLNNLRETAIILKRTFGSSVEESEARTEEPSKQNHEQT